MHLNSGRKLGLYEWLKNLFFLAVVSLSSCTIVKNYQKHKPVLVGNSVDLNGGNFTSDERLALKQRLLGQLDDSSKVTIKDAFFFFHIVEKPPAYDSGYAAVSAKNMKASMLHLGYYNASASFSADTVHVGKQRRVHVHYVVESGRPTLIDTVSYDMQVPELQQLVLKNRAASFLVAGKPVSKTAIQNEMGRLVELFRSNGYYKFTSNDLKIVGDTTISLLTTISDNPFESLTQLAEARQQQDKPTIRLSVVLNPSADTSHLQKFYINNIYIYPDFRSYDYLGDTTFLEKNNRGYIIRYHSRLYRTSFLLRNIFLHKGDYYNLFNYIKTLNNLSKTGVWQSVNIQVSELKDSVGKVDLILQMLPAKKNTFEANIEASYSTNTATNVASLTSSGNLLGLSGNLSLQQRNIRKEGIKMTNTLHGGIELNLNAVNPSNNLVNSNEIGFTNNISIPRTIFKKLVPFIDRSNPESKQSFINTSLSYVDRINLFNLDNISFAAGWQWGSNNKSYILKPLNVEFSYLYNQSQQFIDILNANTFLKYSFNTALVMGSSFGYNSTFINPLHINHQRNFKLNLEESGYPLFIPLGPLGVLKNYMRQFIKTDIEYTYNISYPKTSAVFHLYGGLGVPISRNDLTLPFFKQYYSGGANSMRGWPIRGLGIGGQPLAPYNSVVFNDQTGDIKLEGNFEYRYNILQIIPNSIILKGALFVDAGNVWNFKRNPSDTLNLTNFNIANTYRQLAVDIGTGFRFDFNYFLLRFDLGFRLKRPDILNNGGWQLPDITFQHLFTRGVNDENRIWRYENFNFTIGIGYPF